MELYNALNQLWINFLALFPAGTQAFVSALIIMAVAFGIYSLFLVNPAFSGVTLIVAIPVLLPLVLNFLNEAYKLIIELLRNLPKPPVTPIMPK